ncbi:MAG: hypothetical protein PHP41_01130 [Bacilli bacterium]|jgi:hypothetical protein|nr:hypothetical protein [Bacilli bacterium]MDY0064355.1 hypothetical protein [Bacilli bacterium]
MKSILFVLTFILALALPIDQLKTEFNQEVAAGYSQYVILEEYQNEYFSWEVVHGINRNKMAYGIFLYNDQASSHRIEIVIEGQSYQPTKTHRGDYYLLAVAIAKDITIRVLDEYNSVRREIDIMHVEADDFSSTYAQIEIGQDEGVFFNSLSKTLTLLDWIVITFAGIIVLFGSIIGYMAFAKKGFFKKETRKENVFSYRDFVQTLQQEAIDLDENEPLPLEEKEPTSFPDEEEIDFELAKQLLTRKGFNILYQQLESSEKDKIMLELMLMRDQGIISIEQYQNEVVELWKK